MPHVENVNLTGHFLIAMPAMANPYFAKSLTLICEHNEDGAMGIVLNRPTDMQLDTLFEQVKLKIKDTALASAAVHFGGPVQLERGFVLHQPVGAWKSTLAIDDATALTTSLDILEAVADGHGPQKILVTLGYAGWSAGQLEQELAENAWLSVPAQSTVIFDLPPAEKLAAATALLGVNYTQLSDGAGHA